MPLSEMDYVEELHAQAAAKQRERQQAKLLERAENLQLVDIRPLLAVCTHTLELL